MSKDMVGRDVTFRQWIAKEQRWKRECPLVENEFWMLINGMLEAKWEEDPPKGAVK